MSERERFARACYESGHGPSSSWAAAKGLSTMGARAAVNDAYEQADALISAGFGDAKAAVAIAARTLDAIATILDRSDTDRGRLTSIRSVVSMSGRCEKARPAQLFVVCGGCGADCGTVTMVLDADSDETRLRWARNIAAEDGWVVESGVDLCGDCAAVRAKKLDKRAEKEGAKKMNVKKGKPRR